MRIMFVNIVKPRLSCPESRINVQSAERMPDSKSLQLRSLK